MTNDRASGLALIAGSAGLIITLGLHPSGRDLFEPDKFDAASRTLIAVHSIGLASLPVWFLGACGLARYLSKPGTDDGTAVQLGFSGLVLYGFAMASILSAIVLDGLVTPGIVRRMLDSTANTSEGWKIALRYNGIMDEAFLQVFLVASSLAILLWSLAILRSRRMSRVTGIFGALVALLILGSLLSGLLSRYGHLFGMILIGQAIWFIVVGSTMWNARQVTTDSC
jgi:hypothetical protein